MSHRRARQPEKAPARPEPTTPPSRQPAWTWPVVLALLAVYATLALTSSLDKSPTYDEPAHITAGYGYWKLNDYRLQPENGNLPQRLVSLPWVIGSAVFPDRDGVAWRTSDVWALADEFFHRRGNDLSRYLLLSRACTAMLGAAVCLTVFCWSRQLFGIAGGLLSLALCTLCPTMIAHGQLATSDMCAALMFTLSAWAIWNTLEQVTAARVALSILATSALFLSKYSAVLVLPVALLLVLFHILLRKPTVQRLGLLAGVIALHVIVAWLMIWTAYGWRYAAAAEGQAYEFYKLKTLSAAAEKAGGAGPMIATLGKHRLLPEAYLYGAAFTLAHRQRMSFLLGDYSLYGWPQYFPYCLAVKTPLALFGLLTAAACWGLVAWRQRRIAAVHCLPLVVLLLVYWASALTSTLNIGHRHLLPTYPAMYVLAGAAAHWFSRGPIGGILIGLLVAAFAAESLLAFPHYLAYFNLLVPRERAYHCLVDSNLDWGQDLPRLKQWLVAHADQPAYLSYFGTGSPDYYGIRAARLPSDDLQPGYYCISGTNLQAVYITPPGRWNKTYERAYQTFRSELAKGEVKEPEIAQKQRLLRDLQFARLLAYLRQREPDAEIGYSILIYRLSNDDIQAALQGLPVELDERSWYETQRLTQPP